MNKLTMMHRVVLALLVTGAVAVTSTAYSNVAEVASISLNKGASSSTYVIEQSGTADCQEFKLNNPPRLVVDFVGARHALGKTSWDGDNKWVSAVRSSQFRNDPNEVTRIVFDLKPNAAYKVSKVAGKVTVTFFGKGDQPKVMSASAGASSLGSAWDATPEADAKPMPQPHTEQPKKEQPAKVASPVSPKPEQSSGWQQPSPQQWSNAGSATSMSLTPTSTMSGSGSMMANKKMTIDVQGADIKTVLRSISEFAGVNIVAGPDVTGAVNVHLEETPWRSALDMVLKANGYDYREEYGIIRVATLERLNKEEMSIAQADAQKENMEKLVTQYVKLSFVDADEMKKAMKGVVSKRGSIEIEEGGNSIVITDIQKNVDRVVQLATELDRRVSQVEIVAKMVDIDHEVAREIGVNWGLTDVSASDLNGVVDATSGQLLANPFGDLRFGTVQDWGNLDARIQALEEENKANIISNPRITTTDNREAVILVGKEIPLIVTDEAGNPITELKKVGITLRVKPHVNSDNTITMDLHPEISDLSAQATVQGGVIISLSEADTRVIVNDGQTAVIGGLISESETSLDNGIPVLRELPVFGALFRFSNDTRKKRELVIFVTPRIVGDAGDLSDNMSSEMEMDFGN